MPTPRLVFTVGVFRSSSTWLANIVAEILRTQEPARLVYAENAAELAVQIKECNAYVMKAHQPDPGLKLLIRVARQPVIVSVRHPVDCVASYMQTFGEGFERSTELVAASCDAVLDILSISDPLILNYETRKTRKARTSLKAREAAAVAQIANHIGVALDKQQTDALAAQFAPSAVKRLIKKYASEGVFGDEPKPHHFHADTHWHPGHVGAGETGRGADVLSRGQIKELLARTKRFRKRFSYDDAGGLGAADPAASARQL